MGFKFGFKFEVIEENGEAFLYITKLDGSVEKVVCPRAIGESPILCAWGLFPEIVKEWFDKKI